VRTPPVPRSYRVGAVLDRVATASVPRACSAEYPLSASQLSLETWKDHAVLNLECTPQSTPILPLEVSSVPLHYPLVPP
jgi:hypothetical protein